MLASATTLTKGQPKLNLWGTHTNQLDDPGGRGRISHVLAFEESLFFTLGQSRKSWYNK